MRLRPAQASSSRGRRRRRRARPRTLAFAACAALALLGSLLLLLSSSGVAAAAAGAVKGQQVEEKGEMVFVPTREWQVIPEGAAIPPGLHVRLDMSTGQRMGKIMDPEEAAADASTGQANASTGGQHVVILNDGGGGKASGGKKSRLRVAEEVAEPARTEGEMSAADARSPHETMEVVLLNLPAPERASMGIDAMHAAKESLLAKGEYWARVEALWNERQAMLQQAYDEMLKPAEMLQSLIGTLSSEMPLGGGLRQALVDLEDHLTDIDMARDFYTLGGLRPLVALLGEGQASETRWRAAWALGNAVKNDPSSQLWVLEEVPLASSSVTAAVNATMTTTTTTTALLQLVGALRSAEAAAGGAWGQHDEELLRKAVYALTSAARGNPRVQGALREAGGLEAMAQLLLLSSSALDGLDGKGVGRRRLSLRVKLAAFAHDVAVEAKGMLSAALEVEEARQAGMAEQGERLLAGVTTPDWCLGTLGLLPEVCHPNNNSGGGSAVEAEQVLHALGALHEHCPASHLPPKHLAASLRAAHAAMSSSAFSAALDEEYHAELLALAQELAARAEGKASSSSSPEVGEL